ncbi:hypothetical protein PHYBLDRAFT_64084 [Phycomyces blakesleeanus NRRL 1555(-)]|uniref:Uncharacterized protein n=1 Tax=Phycomyces blakesleeanus (strain ATCC 8743b / DSM 1359 / FGSC 10004 / NBRC 33097 / NRRL 1555) TaxID=763407 RepID=A0A163A3P0_PHYB8|nr:hypothetical protein PHYBLDRAFT_64084 [Phycomyces blakesleeanus NRRL 1555(-)]OAD70841.1 hypothetical protein PHYBLDRAFT_64084 [Phycomyces blakesleeanus NRRL 1555(-)]|eukprot:XP_018288881.1 hypothetical protein PHYBLDRAFT_64084 [Phycomyces blakesleeanus NRRL 1555(-)]
MMLMMMNDWQICIEFQQVRRYMPQQFYQTFFSSVNSLWRFNFSFKIAQNCSIGFNSTICAFFYVDFTEESVNTYRKKIKEFEDSEICWNIREQDPILVLKQRIRGDPLTYKKYLDETPEEKVNKRERVELVTEAQVKQFINEVYCPSQPENDVIYVKGIISTKEIYELVKTFTTVFREKTAQSFAAWCRNQKLNFLLAKEKNPEVSPESYIFWNTFIMVNQDTTELKWSLMYLIIDNLINSMRTYLPKYQESLKNLKKNGYEIIGYARKSPSEDVTSRARLLKSMVSNLKERSFATKIFVSPCSWASPPLVSRDLQGNSRVIMNELSVDGNTQDLLVYLKSVHHDVCLVTIDFAGITTRSEDIVNLVEANPSLKRIAVETFAQCNEVFIFDTERLVKDNGLLQKFENRNYCIQRSK